MSKKMFYLVAVIMSVSLSLVACMPTNSTCPVTYQINVQVPIGETWKTVTQTSFEALATERDGRWFLGEEDIVLKNQWVSRTREKVYGVNTDLAQLFAVSDFFVQPTVSEHLSEVESALSYWPECPNGGIVEQSDIAVGFTPKTNYDTSLDVGEGKVFMTYQTPGGSKLSFSFASWRLEGILKGRFEENPELITQALNVNYEIVATDLTIGDAVYQEVLLRNLLSTRDTGDEVASLSYQQGDYQGRLVLRPMLSRAFELAAADYEGPVNAVLFGHMVDGTVAIGNVSFQQHAASVSGWWILASGVLNSSGGSSELAASYAATTTDIVMGSVFMKEVSK